jgi:hypothetical protein
MKKIGYLATGLVIGMALTVVTPVLADTAKTISAKLNSTVKVAIDGKTTKLSAQPIIYNNTNYLPVGEIGRALNMSVSYDKKTDTIKMDGNSIETPSNPVAKEPTVTKQPETSIPTVKMGESITKDGITVTLQKIEYMPEGEVVSGVVSRKGFKVYYTLTNTTDSPIRPTGTFEFTLDESKYSQEVNSNPRSYILNQYTNLYQNESASGYVYVEFPNDINIAGLSFKPISDTTYFKKPLANWSVN